MNGSDNFAQLVRTLRQDPQLVARDAAAAGKRVVGYVGNDVPVELIIAGGALPVRLRGVDAATPGADKFLESAFAPEVRSIAEQWLLGALDHLHTVVFARTDDSSQRLYYYLCELQRRGLCAGPRPLAIRSLAEAYITSPFATGDFIHWVVLNIYSANFNMKRNLENQIPASK